MTENTNEQDGDDSRLRVFSAVLGGATPDIFDIPEEEGEDGEVDEDEENMRILEIDPKMMVDQGKMDIVADFSKDDFEPKDISVTFTLRMKPEVKKIEKDEDSKSSVLTTSIPELLSVILKTPGVDLSDHKLEVKLNFSDPKTNKTHEDQKTIPLSSIITPVAPPTPQTPVIVPFHKPLRFRRGTATSTKMVYRLRQRSMFPITQTELKQCSPRTLANFLFSTIEHISKNPTHGIFRRSASRLEVGDVLVKIEAGFPCNSSFLKKEVSGIHVVACLIKRWISEIPTRIFSELFKPIIEEKYESEGNNFSLEEVTKVLDSLPMVKKVIFVKLFGLFHSVALEAETTMMDSKNLSIVFTPNLYTTEVIPLLRNKKMNDRALSLTEFLIENVKKIEDSILPKKHKFHKNEKKSRKKFMKFFNDL